METPLLPRVVEDSPPAAAARPRSSQLGERVQRLRLAQLPERRTEWGRIAVQLAIVLLGCFGFWWAYSQYMGQAPPDGADGAAATEPAAPPTQQPASASAPTAAVATTTQRVPLPASGGPAAKSDVVLEAKGYIVPRQQILVSPKVSGMIVKLDVEEGRRVAKGDILAVLESTEYQAEYERALANVRLVESRLEELKNGNRPEEIRQAEAELEEARAQLVQLEADWRRSSELRRRNSISEQEFELAESKYLAQRQKIRRLEAAVELWKLGPRSERIKAAQAELDEARADLVKAEWRLGNCTIRAPISGTILKKNAEEGNIVNPIAFNGSFSLCEMADLSDLEVDLNVAERDISVVRVGQMCRVRVDAWPDRVYEGYVSRLMPIADRAKAAVPVRVKVRIPPEEEGVYLKPEMGAIVTFLATQVEDAPARPEAAAPPAEPQAAPTSATAASARPPAGKPAGMR